MTEVNHSVSKGAAGRIADLLAREKAVLVDYASAISGSAGRLVFSLAYFVALANTLTIADFGLFATASAAGVMLSRLLAFGFIAPLYRVATVRPQLIGAFTAGFLMLSALSLPAIAAAGWAVYALFFAATMPAAIFAAVVAAEALLWRPVEVVVIVLNGTGRFGLASVMVILGTVLRAARGACLHGMAGARPRRLERLLPGRQRALPGGRARGSSIRASGCGCARRSTGGGSAIRSPWPAPKCCSTCRWSSTSWSCCRSAGRISPASTPSSCGSST